MEQNEREETWEEALARLHRTPPVGNLLPMDNYVDIGEWGKETWESAKSIPAPIYNMECKHSKTVEECVYKNKDSSMYTVKCKNCGKLMYTWGTNK